MYRQYRRNKSDARRTFESQIKRCRSERNHEPPFPSVNIDSDISYAVDYLTKKIHAVLVEDGNKTVGIITKYDVLEFLTR